MILYCDHFLFWCGYFFFCFFKQKTAYEMRISDWSSGVCSSDLHNKGIGEAERSTDRGKRGAASTEALHVWAKLFRNCRRRGSGWGLAVLPATDLFPKNY